MDKLSLWIDVGNTQWWDNLVEHCDDIKRSPAELILRQNFELSKYSAVYCYDIKSCESFIRFEREEDVTAFLLRWA